MPKVECYKRDIDLHSFLALGEYCMRFEIICPVDIYEVTSESCEACVASLLELDRG
jgi:hypothetical protein